MKKWYENASILHIAAGALVTVGVFPLAAYWGEAYVYLAFVPALLFVGIREIYQVLFSTPKRSAQQHFGDIAEWLVGAILAQGFMILALLVRHG